MSTAPKLKHASILVINAPDILPHARYSHPSWHGDSFTKNYHHQEPNSSVRTLTLDGFSLSKHMLDDWGRFVDLSQLEELKCTRGRVEVQYFQVAPTLLTNLRHVSLNLAALAFGGGGIETAIRKFISTCHPLESLSLWSWELIPLDLILGQHGKSLKVLQLHEREPVFPGSSRRILTLDELIQVRQSCPLLEDLTIDMDRANKSLSITTETDNLGKFKELAKFGKQFGRLQVYFDVGVKNLAFGSYDPDEDDDEDDDDVYLDDGLTDLDDRGELLDPGSVEAVESRRRLRGESPSTHGSIENFLAVTWRIVFGARRRNTGRMELDVKFGEWERKFGGAFGKSSQEFARHA